MKDLKKKLTAAGAMLVVSAVMLSGVSYAWYTLSTNPEVKGMKTTVVANQNLEIALEKTASENSTAVDTRSVYDGKAQGSKTDNYYTWGNLVDLSKAFETLYGNDTTHPLQIRPVKYLETADAAVTGSKIGDLEFPKYSVDGRVDSLGLLQAKAISNDNTSAPTGGVYGWTENTTNPTDYYAYQVNYWLKSNVGGEIVLSEETKRANDGTTTGDTKVNGIVGGGSNLKVKTTDEDLANVKAYLKNLKIRFVNDDNKYVDAEIGTDTVAKVTDGYATFKLTTKKTEENKITPVTTLQPNTARLIKMYVYLNGETVSNKDALLKDIDEIQMNIQFDNASLTDEAMTGTTK